MAGLPPVWVGPRTEREQVHEGYVIEAAVLAHTQFQKRLTFVRDVLSLSRSLSVSLTHTHWTQCLAQERENWGHSTQWSPFRATRASIPHTLIHSFFTEVLSIWK